MTQWGRVSLEIDFLEHVVGELVTPLGRGSIGLYATDDDVPLAPHKIQVSDLTGLTTINLPSRAIADAWNTAEVHFAFEVSSSDMGGAIFRLEVLEYQGSFLAIISPGGLG